MIFLQDSDFTNKLAISVKAQLLDGSADAFDLAELSAMAHIENSLSELYDLNAEFAKVDSERHRSLVDWTLNLAMYFLYERIPDDQLPPRVVKNYDDTLSIIGKIESGKKNTTLAKLVSETTGKKRTSFRWGSQAKKTH